MKLKDARKLGIKYCEDNNCKYTFISHNNIDEFYLTENENNHTVFLVNRNGSLAACHTTNYAIDFHNEYKKKNNHRASADKRNVAEIYNLDYEYDYEVEMED